VLTLVSQDEQQSQVLQEVETLRRFTQDLPLFQYISHRDVVDDNIVVYHQCKLRSLEQLEEFKKHYQQIYFLVDSIEVKRVLFEHLKKLNYRISRFRFDRRRFH